MKRVYVWHGQTNLEDLYKRIDEQRKILDELCYTIEENREEIIRLSMNLDELIVEYMKQISPSKQEE